MQKIDVSLYKLGQAFMRREEEEQVKEKLELVMCKDCMAFNYNNSWNEKAPAFSGFDRDDEVLVEIRRCPTCTTEKDWSYEGGDYYESGSYYGA